MCAKGLMFSPPVVDFAGGVSPSPRFVKPRGDRFCAARRAAGQSGWKFEWERERSQGGFSLLLVNLFCILPAAL